jgi:hypothetical protein
MRLLDLPMIVESERGGELAALAESPEA